MAQYIFRAYMAYDVRPSDEWSATLEYDIDDSVESPSVAATALNMAAGLAVMVYNNVRIDRVVVSTWQQDSDPYDINALRTISIGIFGDREYSLTNVVADELTLFLRKNVFRGRTGKMLLRGVLTVAQLTSNSGSWTILPIALPALLTAVEDMWTFFTSGAEPVMIGAALLDITYPATAAGVKQEPVKVYATSPTVRNISGLDLVGPRSRQLTQ